MPSNPTIKWLLVRRLLALSTLDLLACPRAFQSRPGFDHTRPRSDQPCRQRRHRPLAPSASFIVGGGPAGLSQAHALAGTGIDYVLLERRDTVVQSSGLGLALWPHAVRILDQLGLFEEAMGICVLLKDKYNYLPDRAEICHTDLL
jgi:hypothetical protein